MKIFLTLISIILLSGCSGNNQVLLKKQASLELKCPQNKLQLKTIAERTVGITGCKHRAVYLEECTDSFFFGRLHCNWKQEFLSKDQKGGKS